MCIYTDVLSLVVGASSERGLSRGVSSLVECVFRADVAAARGDSGVCGQAGDDELSRLTQFLDSGVDVASGAAATPPQKKPAAEFNHTTLLSGGTSL